MFLLRLAPRRRGGDGQREGDGAENDGSMLHVVSNALAPLVFARKRYAHARTCPTARTGNPVVARNRDMGGVTIGVPFEKAGAGNTQRR
jgi:hypothetical protein